MKTMGSSPGGRGWKWQTQVTKGAAAGAVGWMKRLAAHPAVRTALADGTISPSWARHICTWTDQFPADGRDDADQILLAAAAGGAVLPDLAALAEEMRRRTAAPDPDGPHGDDGFDERRVRLGLTFGGAGVLDGDLTPACAAALQAVLEALAKKAGPEDVRTAPQRRHDALEEACRRLIGAGCLPDRAGQPTQVQLHLTLEQLRDLPGAADAEAAWTTAQAGAAARAGETARAAAEGQPGWLTGRAAQAYACDAAITPIVTGTVDQAALAALAAELRATTRASDPQHPPTPAELARLHEILLRRAAGLLSGPGGLASFLRTRLTGDQVPSASLPLDTGTPTSQITGALRRAVITRDRHCAFPGCDIAPNACQVHHIKERANGGQTSLDQPGPALRLPPPHRRTPMGLDPHPARRRHDHRSQPGPHPHPAQPRPTQPRRLSAGRRGTLCSMTVLVWITEDSWQACVDAVQSLAPAGQDVTLLHVTDTAALEAAHGAFTALLGRSRVDPGTQLEAMAEDAAEQVLAAAAERLGRPAQQLRLRGRPEHQVVGAARGADLLVLAREGAAAGPKSLGKAARFVVDHAACPVLLIWPGPVPAGPPPPPPPPPHRRPHPLE